MSLIDSGIRANCKFDYVDDAGNPYTELWEFEKTCHRKTWRIGQGWTECTIHFDQQFLGYSAFARGTSRMELEAFLWPNYKHPLREYPKFWDKNEVLEGLHDGAGIAVVQSTYDSRMDLPDVAAFEFAEIVRSLLPLPREKDTDLYRKRVNMFNRGLNYLRSGYPTLTYLLDGLAFIPDPWRTEEED